MLIKKVKAKKILNSRKEEAIKVIVKTTNGKYFASAPSGASKGKNEVADFPKGGVDKSISIINDLELKDFEINSFEDFKKLEEFLKKYDGTKDFSVMGGNAIIALEFALLKALSHGKVWKLFNEHPKRLPRPLGNCVGGGKHVKGANKPTLQEFLLLSLDARDFEKSVEANKGIYQVMKEKLKNYSLVLNDENAISPDLDDVAILNIMKSVTEESSLDWGFNVKLGLDMAASSFYEKGNYNYKGKKISRENQIKFVKELIKRFGLVYVEDPLEQNDFKGFVELKAECGDKCFICGDDLTCTNPTLLKKAIKMKAINAVIVKPNQIGSIVKTKEFVDLAKQNKITPIISHRSGETEETIIAHLAVGFDIPIIKAGIIGKEREIKLEEIKKIKKEIKENKNLDL